MPLMNPTPLTAAASEVGHAPLDVRTAQVSVGVGSRF